MDAIDTHLLSLLQEDAKVSFAKMGEAVGLSAPAVLERVRKLESAGVIVAYRAILAAEPLGLGVGAFVGVAIEGLTAERAFREHIQGLAVVLEAHHVTGAWTLMLKVRTETNRDLERLLDDLRTQPGVTRTETMIILSTSVEKTQFPVPQGGPPRPRTRKK